jgi:hypothetical protein
VGALSLAEVFGELVSLEANLSWCEGRVAHGEQLVAKQRALVERHRNARSPNIASAQELLSSLEESLRLQVAQRDLRREERDSRLHALHVK